MTDLDDLWRSFVHPLGLYGDRPDFRRNPDYQCHDPRAPDAPPEAFPQTLYQDLVRARPAIAQALLQILTPGTLRDAVAANQPDAAELAFELLVLPQGVDRDISDFSAAHYIARYPDVAEAGFVPLQHYLDHGMAEGRDTLRKLRKNFTAGALPWDPEKKTVLIAVHELSTTGAPIVGLQLVQEASVDHNVVVVALRGGPLLDRIRSFACCVFHSENPSEEIGFVLTDLMDRVEYAVLNSAETVPFLPLLVDRNIPFVVYIHEYAQYCLPAYKTIHLSAFADFLVYSSESVRDTWRDVHLDTGFDTETCSAILAQAVLNPQPVAQSDYAAARAAVSDLLGFDLGQRKLVYCAGYAHWRKGTDLFVMTAQMAHRHDPQAIFLVIGDGLNHEDVHSGVWIEKHLAEAGANQPAGYLFTVPGGPHYKQVCQAADVMMLASRLDPLPNVVLDAVKYDCDVVLFDKGSGFDDPQYHGMPKLHRVGFGLLDDAARCIADLGLKSERTLPKTPGAAPAEPGEPLFETISQHLMAKLARQRHFFVGAGQYDLSLLYSVHPRHATQRQRERQKAWNLGRKTVWKSDAEAARTLAASDHPVHRAAHIRPYGQRPVPDAPDFSIHVHAFYTDEFDYDLQRFAAYRAAKRILVTTDTAEKANLLHAVGKSAGIALEVRQIPNQGRDILPFMKLFYSDSGIGAEGIWGHVHQKKSIGSSVGGDIWREFMLRILLGDESAVSTALTAMADPAVGLSAPFDPFVVGWYGARRLFPTVSDRLQKPIPPHPIVFTVGNMFWTRPEVVRKMIGTFGQAHAYPNEPIANDGTVFHLIERLWPIAAAECGLQSVFISKPDQRRR